MTRLTSSDAARRDQHFAPFFWIPVSDAPNFTPPRPWDSGFRNQIVDGQEAVLFKHPARERALCKVLDRLPLLPVEQRYLEHYRRHR